MSECPLVQSMRHLRTLQEMLDNRGIAEQDDFCATVGLEMGQTLDDMNMFVAFCGTSPGQSETKGEQ